MAKTRVVHMILGGAAVLLVALLLGGSFWPLAQAQPAPAPPAPAVGRYQISSFGYRWSDGSTCGAYILDSQTGEVFQVIGKNAPEPIGSVAKQNPKK